MKAKVKFIIIGLLGAIILSACASASAGGPKKISYSLKTNMLDGTMVLIGVGGNIDGVRSPTLHANMGDTVEITLTSGDGIEHDISFPDFDATSERVMGQGSSATISFVADKSGSFIYSCTIPGHIDAGMKGTFEVAAAPAQ